MADRRHAYIQETTLEHDHGNHDEEVMDAWQEGKQRLQAGDQDEHYYLIVFTCLR